MARHAESGRGPRRKVRLFSVPSPLAALDSGRRPLPLGANFSQPRRGGSLLNRRRHSGVASICRGPGGGCWKADVSCLQQNNWHRRHDQGGSIALLPPRGTHDWKNTTSTCCRSRRINWAAEAPRGRPLPLRAAAASVRSRRGARRVTAAASLRESRTIAEAAGEAELAREEEARRSESASSSGSLCTSRLMACRPLDLCMAPDA